MFGCIIHRAEFGDGSHPAVDSSCTTRGPLLYLNSLKLIGRRYMVRFEVDLSERSDQQLGELQKEADCSNVGLQTILT